MVLFISVLAVWSWQKPPAFTEACIEVDNSLAICAASNMARASRKAPIPIEHNDFDLSDKIINLDAARNESIGFQLILKTLSNTAPDSVTISPGPWSTSDPVNKLPISTLFAAHYHLVDKGGYTWGPKSKVLPWPAAYPDALIPQQASCLETPKHTQLFNSIPLAKTKNHNQAIWIDTYIPATTPFGQYQLPIAIALPTQTITINVAMTVHKVTLPDRPSIDAIGELYRTYNLENAGVDRSSIQWQKMSHCYQQLAHQHRMVFIERTPVLPDAAAWRDYIKTYTPALNGELFSAKYGYQGTGVNTAVTVWRTPWPQEFNITLEAPLTQNDFDRYTDLTAEWDTLVSNEGWNQTRFFAYVFDEVDGPNSIPDGANEHDYLAMVHEQMLKLQQAIDKGSDNTRLDLLWTSHANPANWADNPRLDMSGKTRLWSPNASAADPAFLQNRIKAGDRVWFYHSGHPAVGIHSINASGIEMRTWGVIGARYGIQGQLMWAVNLGNDDRPFAEPSYKPDDDRFGNGVLVYPGFQLDKIGYPKSAGPIPSMRLKAWRRGLQDAELYYLALAKHPSQAKQLIQEIMPEALADARGKPSWDQSPKAWIDFRKALIRLAN